METAEASSLGVEISESLHDFGVLAEEAAASLSMLSEVSSVLAFLFEMDDRSWCLRLVWLALGLAFDCCGVVYWYCCLLEICVMVFLTCRLLLLQ